ncbi:MAG: EboA domain-containing protein [Verrucomicrobiota bacterium]
MQSNLLTTLKSDSPPEALASLQATLTSLRKDFSPRPFYYAFSGATRHFGRGPDQIARQILLLELAKHPRDTYLATLESLLGAADIREAVVILQTFPHLPEPEALVPLAREATRSNVVDIFDAIALDNTFPKDHFPEDAWNQLVLKALFIDRPLYRITGLDHRANPTLAKAISNLAHERWAAGREINPEAWRCCTPFIATGTISTDLQSLASRRSIDKQALALVLHQAGPDQLPDLRPSVQTDIDDVETEKLTWKSLGESLTRES